MTDCSRCSLVRRRLRRIPASPGYWGKFLAGVIAAFWAVTLWDNAPGVDQLAGVSAVIALFGRTPSALWMGAVAAVPIVDAMTDVLPLRVLGATFGLVTWTTLLFELVVQDGVLHPAVGDCLVGLLGCLNADIGLARQTAEAHR
jgi:hypothetical protein